MVSIREEQQTDHESIDAVIIEAFGNRGEADLVDRLRKSRQLTLSLVAVVDSEVVGHVAFSPVTIHSEEGHRQAIGLGPMAVRPASQRSGIGSELIHCGLDMLRERGDGIVVVLGHPEYYPRFGFERSTKHGIQWEHDAPEEAFMVMALQEGALRGVSGTVRYRPEFDIVI